MLQMGETKFLIECGVNIKTIQKATGFKLTDIAFCLITHEHKDHSKSVKELMQKGIDCYMSTGTKDILGLTSHRAKVIKGNARINDLIITEFDVEHDAADPVGFVVSSKTEKLLFVTDTYFVKYRFDGLTHIMIECNYSEKIVNDLIAAGCDIPQYKRVIRSHFELENVKEFLRINKSDKLKEVHLIHLSDGNSDESEFKKQIAGVVGVPVYIGGKR